MNEKKECEIKQCKSCKARDKRINVLIDELKIFTDKIHLKINNIYDEECGLCIEREKEINKIYIKFGEGVGHLNGGNNNE